MGLARAAVVAAVALLLVAAAPAFAGTTSNRDRGGVARGKGLSAAQRRALDISRITAVASPKALIVTVRMKGNVRRHLGRGKLRRAMVALVLRGRRRQVSLLATTRRSRRPLTLRKTRTRRVAVVRSGRSLTFVLAGSPARVRRISVRSFRVAPRRRARSSATQQLSDQDVEAILDGRFDDVGRVTAPASVADCASFEEQLLAVNRRSFDVVRDGTLEGREQARQLDVLNVVRREVEDVLLERCIGFESFSGYEHRGLSTDVCADVNVFPREVERIRFRADWTFRHPTDPSKNSSGEFEEVDPGFDAEGRRRLKLTVNQYGRYTFVLFFSYRLRSLPNSTILIRREVTVGVGPPPPNQTKDCD